ncbi:MAG: ferredoxin family protein [Candidatus Omnitrophota bacterium]
MKKCKIIINTEKCKGCSLCIDTCPKKLFKLTDKTNKRGLRYAEIANHEKCIACNLCVMMCPDCAIEIEVEE